MLTMLFDTQWFYDLILAAAIVLVILFCFKYPNAKWFVGTIFTVAMIALTVYCGTQINYYYSAKGGIFGAITGIFDTNIVEVNEMTISLKNIELVKEHDDTYSAKVLSNEVMALAEGEKFAVYVNGEPCSLATNDSDYVVANYTYMFLGQEFDELCSDTLTFRIAFYSKSTYLSVSTDGGAEAVKFWNYYFNKNKFDLKIDKAEYIQGDDIIYGEGDVSSYYKIASYYFNDELYSSQVYVVNTPLTLLDTPELTEGKTFVGWQDENEVAINNGIKVTENLSLYGYSVKGINFEFDTTESTRGRLLEYTGTSTVVNIPSTYSLSHGVAVKGSDFTVTDICGAGNMGFPNSITEIIIPETIETVGENAFTKYEFIDNVAHRTTLSNLKKVYVNSKAVYDNLTREANLGGLFYTDTIDFYIQASVDDGSNAYLNTQYDKTAVSVDGTSYNLYTFKENAEVVVSFYKLLAGHPESSADYELPFTAGAAIGTFPEMPATYKIIQNGKEKEYVFTNKWQDAEGNEVTAETVVTGQMSVYAIYTTVSVVTDMLSGYPSEEAFNSHLENDIMPLYESGEIIQLWGIFDDGNEYEVINGCIDNLPTGVNLVGYKYKILN